MVSAIPRFLGIRLPDASEDLLRRTNPLTYLGPGIPRFLIQHGSDDQRAGGAIHGAGTRATRGCCLKPTSDSMLFAERVLAFLSAALAPFGKAALDMAS